MLRRFRSDGNQTAATARRSQRGASMVEFAIVLPLFVVMVFGIIEAGWLFAQLTETRNAAREGARIAVVDFGTATQIATETCNRASLTAGGGSVEITTVGDVTDPIGDPTASVTVTVDKSYSAITGLFNPLFGGTSLDSTVTMRVERPLTNLASNTSYPAEACP